MPPTIMVTVGRLGLALGPPLAAAVAPPEAEPELPQAATPTASAVTLSSDDRVRLDMGTFSSL